MKGNLKKTLLIAFAVALTLAFANSAFAEAPTISDQSVTSVDGFSITVEATINDPVEDQEFTILVVPKGTDLEELIDSDIKYINQVEAEDGEIDFTFVMPEDAEGDYDVYLGGTSITTTPPAKAEFNMSTAPDTFELIGSFTIIAGGDYTTATVIATDVDDNTKTYAVDMSDATNGSYTLNLPNGTYNISIAKFGYLTKTYSNVLIDDDDEDLGSVALAGGEITGDGLISLADLSPFLTNFNKNQSAANWTDIAFLDFNLDGLVSLTDLSPALSNFNKNVNTAY